MTIECIGVLLEFNEIEKKVFAFAVYRALVTFHNKGFHFVKFRISMNKSRIF